VCVCVCVCVCVSVCACPFFLSAPLSVCLCLHDLHFFLSLFLTPSPLPRALKGSVERLSLLFSLSSWHSAFFLFLPSWLLNQQMSYRCVPLSIQCLEVKGKCVGNKKTPNHFAPCCELVSSFSLCLYEWFYFPPPPDFGLGRGLSFVLQGPLPERVGWTAFIDLIL